MQAEITEQFQVLNRWTGAVQSRRTSPRAVPAVRACVAHTSAQKRRLDIFVTQPVREVLGWKQDGIVSPSFFRGCDCLLVKLVPAHSGLRATAQSHKSGTVRIAVSGAPLSQGLCAKVRPVSYTVEGSTLIAELPMDWALEYCALSGIEVPACEEG